MLDRQVGSSELSELPMYQVRFREFIEAKNMSESRYLPPIMDVGGAKMSQRFKQVLSWVVIASGAVGGCLWVGFAGSRPVLNHFPIQTIAAMAFVLFGISLLLGSLAALRRPKVAAMVLLCGVATQGLWISGSKLFQYVHADAIENPPPSSITVSKAALVTFGLGILIWLFWLITSNVGWLPVRATRIRVTHRLIVALVALVLTQGAATIFDLYGQDWAECHFSPLPFWRQQSPEQAVFQAQPIVTHVLWPSRAITMRYPGILRKQWALAIVKTQFWGLPWWDRKIVILTSMQRGGTDFFQNGQEYFVEGRRRLGLLTRFLPIFSTFCTRTAALDDAAIDLRILQEGAPRDGIRIIGRTIRLDSNFNQEPVAAAKVVIVGPAGRIIATSDRNGVYDLSGLPPGDYKVGVESDNEQISWEHPECGLEGWRRPFRSGDIRDCTVTVR